MFMKHILSFHLFEASSSVSPYNVLPTNNLKANYGKVKDCINIVLKTLHLKGFDLMLEIGMVETGLGTIDGSIRTSGDGGRGIWQIDRVAFNDVKNIKKFPHLKKYHDLVKNHLGIDINSLVWDDCNKILIGCIFARLVIFLKNITPNETSRKERALQWKKYYNTSAGKGTPEKYWKVVQDFYKILKLEDKWAGISYNQADVATYSNNIQDNDYYKISPDSTKVHKKIPEQKF